MSLKIIDFLESEEEGAHAVEHLLILAFVVIPSFLAIALFEEILREYVAFEVASVTSPFF